MSQPLHPKKEVALALLERLSVYVHLDPRSHGVVVPSWFKKQAELVLQIGLNMPIPIPDLRLDDEGLSCTLSFNRQPFFCVVPWPSVFAMVGEDGRGLVWPEDVPPEVAEARQQKRPVLEAVRAPELTSVPLFAAAPAPAAKPKKSRKKPQAVPRAAEAEARPMPPPRIVPAPAPATSEPRAAAPKTGSGGNAGAGSRKPKRELPPYLRVIK